MQEMRQKMDFVIKEKKNRRAQNVHAGKNQLFKKVYCSSIVIWLLTLVTP